MKKYDVFINIDSDIKVTVEAADGKEAMRIVKEKFDNGTLNYCSKNDVLTHDAISYGYEESDEE